jgi:hypothetical protein
MRHTLSGRALSPEEAAALRGRWWHRLERWIDYFVIMPIMLGAAPCMLSIVVGAPLLWLFQRLGGNVSTDFAGRLFTVASILSIIGACWGMVEGNRLRKRRRTDLKKQVAEVIEVTDARLVEAEEYNDEGPLYYFGIGDDKILFLGGQWLWMRGPYGIERPDLGEEGEDAGPPFPAVSFVLHRLPGSGKVLRIEIRGERLAPEAVLHLKTQLPKTLKREGRKAVGRQSAILEWDFDALVKLAHRGK